MPQKNPFLNLTIAMSAELHDRHAASRHASYDDHELRRDDFICAEEYARYLRQSGLEPTDQYGRPAFELISGSGPEASLHRAIHGHDHAGPMSKPAGSKRNP